MNWNYISGFFDADGSITAIKNHRNEEITVQLNFSNNEKSILEDIQSFILKELKIKGFISKKKAKEKNHTDNYDLKYTYFPKCLLIVSKLKSKHSKKVHRISLLKELHSLTPRNGKYTKELLQKREKVINNFFSS
jgi:hypothetical protein